MEGPLCTALSKTGVDFCRCALYRHLPTFYAEIFPTRVRYTAPSIGYNIAVAIFGGLAPFVAMFLLRMSGNNHAPAVYVIVAPIVTLVVLLRTRETAFAPLR